MRARVLLRWGHIAAGAFLSAYILSPMRLDPTATLAAQVVVIGLGLSGLAIWQYPRISRRLRG